MSEEAAQPELAQQAASLLAAALAAPSAAGPSTTDAAPAAPAAPAASSASRLLDGPYLDRYKLAREGVPFFDGRGAYTAPSFITKVKASFATFGVEELDQVPLATSRISGTASSFVNDLARDFSHTVLSFPEFETHFLSRFPVAPEDTPQFILLHQIKLGGGSLAKYVQDFNAQLSRAGPPRTAWENMLQELFLTGLGLPLRQLVEQARPEGGWSSLGALESTSATVHHTANLSAPMRSTNSGSSRESGQKRPAALPAGPAKKTRHDNKSAYNSLFCTNCEIKGHEVADCKRKAAGLLGPIKGKAKATKESKNS